MTNKEINDLIKLIDKSDLAEFKLKNKDFSIRIRSKEFFSGKGQQVVSMMPAAAPAASPAPAVNNTTAPAENNSSAAAPEEAEDDKYFVFKSPMVGTFYRKPSPDKEVFAKVGDQIKQGDVVAIIEAMKLFNEIESEVSGTIVKVLVDDQTPVEFDQPLFLVDPA